MVSPDPGSAEHAGYGLRRFSAGFQTLSFLAEEIYVYTPKGDVKMLPIGATALDFAFAVHSAVGSQMYRCKSES